ncbi:hypothetical protein QAD02_014420 [Eretmocerus hayati]|uniref:Uncharacterized protein n=1 Tax=Eretmocerus hayati TaxID=131215 RepID=A0ACC2P6A2_9HYME|nr:hypothetical protein QAD02_014420 [Eretmocerus hayati]
MGTQEEDCTLLVLHLPPGLSDERREELFKKYGAIKTTTVRKSAKYSMTFAKFPNENHAKEVLFKLHQVPVQGRRLSVEFAKKSIAEKECCSEYVKTQEQVRNLEDKMGITEEKKKFQEFLRRLNTWCPQDIFLQPMPPYLKYKYPEPTREILLRIAVQLVKERAFYTQVLHLMNKMNLPPPFEDLEDEFPIIKEAYNAKNFPDLFGVVLDSQVPKEPEVHQPQMQESSEEEESEIESDKEMSQSLQTVPQKRKNPQSKKRLKIPKFVNPLKQQVMTAPSTSKKHRPRDVFEPLKRDLPSQRIVVKPVETTKTLESTSIVVQNPNVEGFGLILPSKDNDDEEKSKEGEPRNKCITTEQLHENRISTHDQRVLPVFNNYHPGKPSNRLYIKNLAKQVEEDDLHFIYRRYILPKTSNDQPEYNVRLMQEGRMKGQAFITLPNVAQAKLALEETNGYILKDKPMVVHFAKVGKN